MVFGERMEEHAFTGQQQMLPAEAEVQVSQTNSLNLNLTISKVV